MSETCLSRNCRVALRALRGQSQRLSTVVVVLAMLWSGGSAAFGQPADTTMPNLVGTLLKADSPLPQGLKPTDVRIVFADDKQPKGTVMKTSPAAGQPVSPKDGVLIVVSDGSAEGGQSELAPEEEETSRPYALFVALQMLAVLVFLGCWKLLRRGREEKDAAELRRQEKRAKRLRR